MQTIDLNCDLGEGAGNDAELMPYLSSCNIACGGHAGNEASMRATLRLAKAHGVKCGAHPSFPDRENFGRKPMKLPRESLLASLKSQIAALAKIAREEGVQLHHLKPHGALYNQAAKDADTAAIVLEAMRHFPEILLLYAPFGSEIARQARQQGIVVCYEAFADRAYQADLQLLPRSQPNAVLHDPEVIAEHVLRMVLHKKVVTPEGQERPLQADTLCIHGDNPEALAVVKQLHLIFEKNRIRIA